MTSAVVSVLPDFALRERIRDREFLQGKAVYFNGENVEAVFVSGMPERVRPQRGGVYLQGIDPAKSQDSAWSIVLKVVDNPDDPTRPFVVGVSAEEAIVAPHARPGGFLERLQQEIRKRIQP